MISAATASGSFATWCRSVCLFAAAAVLGPSSAVFAEQDGGGPAGSSPWIVFKGDYGPGWGKHVVLVSGDEEYRSEEALPQLAKILSERHGFRCTVLFAIDPETGEIDPENTGNIPGLELLKSADLMIIATRFRQLPEDQMRHLAEYVEAGKPVLGMRTATHAFNIPGDAPFARYGWRSKVEGYEGGFGRQVLGETWVSHHGRHKHESTLGVVVEPDHPIMRGIEAGDIWGPTDVYTVRMPLPGDSNVLVRGAVLEGMDRDDAPVTDGRNDPMMPIAWTRTHNGGRVFTTTMGAATDLVSEGVRRMLVNAAYWCVGQEERIRGDADVSLVGDYDPSAYGFGEFVKGRKPGDYR